MNLKAIEKLQDDKKVLRKKNKKLVEKIQSCLIEIEKYKSMLENCKICIKLLKKRI